MASWLYFLRKVAALSTEGRERLEIGGASGHSHSGAGFGISFEELTKADTPNLSTLPTPS